MLLEDKFKSNNLEREQEQIDRIVKESGGKLTRRLVNSQVMELFLSFHLRSMWFIFQHLNTLMSLKNPKPF